VEGCECKQFTWQRFTNAFLAVAKASGWPTD
jgi:hypothetical protein